MNYTSKIAVVPLRSEPSHRSEMVSQLLYGESLTILEELPEWVKVKCDHDGYLGWADNRSFQEAKEVSKYKVVTRTLGTTLDGFDTRLSFGALVDINHSYEGVVNCLLNPSDEEPFNLLDFYLNEWMGTPYLWGGRSTFGTDCSGLVQVVFGALGINLPRNASQQIRYGAEVLNFHEKKKGDLAFFESPSGSITHVGILMDDEYIIHASAWVRQQKLSPEGIIDESNTMTHKLAGIRRFA